MRLFIYLFPILFFLPNQFTYAQADSLEVYIIDAYVTPEKPHTFELSFFTIEPVKTNVVVNHKFSYKVSESYSEDHSIKIDFSEMQFSQKFIPYQIIGINENGEEFVSEEFELILPYEEFIETKEGKNPIQSILFGMGLYFLPSVNFFVTGNDEYFSLTKEIPIVSFYAGGYNYPAGNISFEYTHIYDDNVHNIIRLGYKQIIPINYIEFISPGITAFSNLNGYNGIGAEISLGLFKFHDIFTFYSRYRYNFQPETITREFNEFSIGLYSNFFTIDF